MSENLELCPKCKQGHLRDAGGVTIKREIEPRLRQTGSSIRERICDQCGHRQVDQYLNEYGEPASDLLSGTVTKQNQGGVEEKLFTCDCGASFKTDKELLEHHQSEHGEPASDKVTGTRDEGSVEFPS